MCEKLDTADVQARKAYLRSVIAQIEVGDGKIRVFSDKTALAASATAENTSAPNVRGFVRDWRTRRDSNSRPRRVAQQDCRRLDSVRHGGGRPQRHRMVKAGDLFAGVTR